MNVPGQLVMRLGVGGTKTSETTHDDGQHDEQQHEWKPGNQQAEEQPGDPLPRGRAGPGAPLVTKPTHLHSRLLADGPDAGEEVRDEPIELRRAFEVDHVGDSLEDV